MKKRIVALLLCCVMLLTLSPSLIATATADDADAAQQVEQKDEAKDETKDEAKDETKDETKDEAKDETKDETKDEAPAFDVKAAYDALMACTTAEDMIALSNKLTDEQIAMFSDEQIAALNAKYDALMPEAPEDLGSVVPFLNVAPLVSGTASVRRAARNVAAQADDSEENKAVELKKTATANGDGTYTITLEAYATGESTSQTYTEAVDIVLVLDVSGSMDDTMKAYREVYSGALDKNKDYYIRDGRLYREISYSDRHGSWGYSSGFFGWKWVSFTPKDSANDTNTSHTQFYEPTPSSDNKMKALQSAVNSFIDNVAKNSADSNIAIVKFAGDKTDHVGNETYRDGYYTYNYTQIVKNLTTVDANGATQLKNAVNALKPAGATSADYGMQHAQTIINGAANDGKKKVVIMFTDGEPNHNNGFDSTVANGAINASKSIKNAGATVYAIGVFDGANGTPVNGFNGVSNTNKYMHLVSSNYKNATGMNNPGTATYPADGKSYYLSAGSASELSSIFQQISQEVGGTKSTLDATSVIKDIIAPSFTLPDGATASSITLETWKYNGPSYNAANAWTKNADAMGATASIVDGQVNVTGFDFKANWCGLHQGTPGGNKLVIKFKVTPKADFLGGNDVPTNGADSGIYDKDNNPVKKFDVPTVNAAIAPVTVTAQDKNVYLLGSVTADDLKSGAIVKVGNVPLDLSAENYGLEAWQNKYVDITVTVKDAAGNAIPTTGLTDDQKYTIEVKVAPKTTTPTSTEGTQATEQSGSGEGSINVFKPELTFKDSTAYYGETVPANNNYSGNQVGAEKWMHDGTEAVPSEMLGEKPTLDISYTPDESKLKDGKYTKQDVPVSATVKINGTDVTGKTTFVHQDCTDKTCTLPTGYHFWIHVKTCQLTITKQGGDAGEPYVFTVKKDGEKYTEVTIKGGKSETIYELPVGTYTIEENTKWSWRYPSPAYSGGVTLSADQTSREIICTNARTIDKWLNGFSDVVTNTFGAAHN